MRLDKAISSQGGISRSEVRKLAKKGRITVDGVVCKDPGQDVDPEQMEIVCDGVPLHYKAHLYLMLNKPLGVVSATEDRVHTTVLDLVPPELFRAGLFPAGRLDADTTGFVLLTDDGALAHRLLAPKSHVWKTYRVTLADPVLEAAAQEIRQGITLADGTQCLPAEVTLLGPCEAEVRLREGKYHEIRRMFAATGNRVTALVRTRFGGVPLDPDLAEGECRELTETEVSDLENG